MRSANNPPAAERRDIGALMSGPDGDRAPERGRDVLAARGGPIICRNGIHFSRRSRLLGMDFARRSDVRVCGLFCSWRFDPERFLERLFEELLSADTRVAQLFLHLSQ